MALVLGIAVTLTCSCQDPTRESKRIDAAMARYDAYARGRNGLHNDLQVRLLRIADGSYEMDLQNCGSKPIKICAPDFGYPSTMSVYFFDRRGAGVFPARASKDPVDFAYIINPAIVIGPGDVLKVRRDRWEITDGLTGFDSVKFIAVRYCEDQDLLASFKDKGVILHPFDSWSDAVRW